MKEADPRALRGSGTEPAYAAITPLAETREPGNGDPEMDMRELIKGTLVASEVRIVNSLEKEQSAHAEK